MPPGQLGKGVSGAFSPIALPPAFPLVYGNPIQFRRVERPMIRVEHQVFVETDAQKAKAHRQRAARIKQLSKKIPDKKDRQALLGLAASFLQMADELERIPRLQEKAAAPFILVQNSEAA